MFLAPTVIVLSELLKRSLKASFLAFVGLRVKPFFVLLVYLMFFLPRFLTYHCLLYNETSWCLDNQPH